MVSFVPDDLIDDSAMISQNTNDTDILQSATETLNDNNDSLDFSAVKQSLPKENIHIDSDILEKEDEEDPCNGITRRRPRR